LTVQETLCFIREFSQPRTEPGTGIGAAFLRREHGLADQSILDFHATGAHFGTIRSDDDIDCLDWPGVLLLMQN
jgi:hypothetical protein